MLKYNDLKKSPDGMPTWDSLIPVVMAIAVGEGTWKGRELKRKVADYLGLPITLRNKMYDGGNDIVIEDRAGWAMSRLKVAGLFNNPRRGYGEVTELGRELYEKHGNMLNDDILRQQGGFIQRHQMNIERSKEKEGKSEVEELLVDETEENPAEIMSAVESRHKDEVANDLLEKIYSQTPRFFEHLAVELLIAMGYKGLDGFARVTSATKDGGHRWGNKTRPIRHRACIHTGKTLSKS